MNDIRWIERYYKARMRRTVDSDHPLQVLLLCVLDAAPSPQRRCVRCGKTMPACWTLRSYCAMRMTSHEPREREAEADAAYRHVFDRQQRGIFDSAGSTPICLKCACTTYGMLLGVAPTQVLSDILETALAYKRDPRFSLFSVSQAGLYQPTQVCMAVDPGHASLAQLWQKTYAREVDAFQPRGDS